MYNSRFITITNSWLGKNEIFCLRFVWNLVWWILIPIPPTIPNFSWIGGSLFLVQNYDTRCLCKLFSVSGTRVLFFVEFTKYCDCTSFICLNDQAKVAWFTFIRGVHPTQVKDQTITKLVFKAKTSAIETNQTPDWVIVE